MRLIKSIRLAAKEVSFNNLKTECDEIKIKKVTSQRIKWTMNEKYPWKKKSSHGFWKPYPILNWKRENVLKSKISSKEFSK